MAGSIPSALSTLITNTQKGSVLDICSISCDNNLKTTIQNQLGLSSMSITITGTSSSTSIGGNTAVRLEGTYDGDILNTSVLQNKIRLYLWSPDETSIYSALAFQFSTSGWTMNTSFTPSGDTIASSTNTLLGYLVSTNYPLIVLSTGSLTNVDCSTICGGTYSSSASIVPNLNIFFSTKPDASLSTSYQNALSLLTDSTGFTFPEVQLFGTIDNSDTGFPIITLNIDYNSTITRTLFSSDLKSTTLYFGVGTSKDTSGNNPILIADALFFITSPISSKVPTTTLIVEGIVPIDSPTSLNVSMVKGQSITLNDINLILTTLSQNNISFTDLLPSTLGTIATDTIFTDLCVSFDIPSFKISSLNATFNINKLATTTTTTTTISDISRTLKSLVDISNPFNEAVTISLMTVKTFTVSFDYDFTKSKFTTASTNISLNLTNAITISDLKFSLNSINILADVKDSSFSDVTFSLGIAIGTITFGMKGGYTAAVSNKNDAYWNFSGEMDSPKATLSDILTGIGCTTSIPSWLEDITVKTLSGTYTTASYTTYDEEGTSTTVDEAISFDIELNDSYFKENFDIQLKTDYKDSTIDLSGILTLTNPSTKTGLTLSLDLTEHTDMKATAASTGDKPIIEDIIQIFDSGYTLPVDFPKALDITAVTFQYQLYKPAVADPKTDAVPAEFALGITDRTYGTLVIAGSKPMINEKPSIDWLIGFQLTFNTNIDFGKLPLVGGLITDHGGFSLKDIFFKILPEVAKGIKLSFLSLDTYTSFDTIDATDKKSDLQVLIGADSDELDNPLQFDVASLVSKLKASEEANPEGEQPENENQDGDNPGKEQSGGEEDNEEKSGTNSDEAAEEDKPSNEQAVSKSFGSVHLQKVSLGYASEHINVDISGTLSLGGISLSLEGLSIGIPFPFENNANFTFGLDGMGVDVQEGPLTIAGGFLKVSDDNYMGEVNIQAGEFGLQAYGGYGKVGEDTSFFILVNADFPIGGPPFFFVDGIAGGFGINRAFKLPTQLGDLTTYPLMPGSKTIPTSIGSGQSGLDQMTTALTNLNTYVYPEKGNYWVAAGLDVTSFEMVQIDALLSVSFGVDLEIALLANAQMTLPVSEDPEPLAFIDIDFLIAVEPNKGIFMAMGALTPASYIYSGLAHLGGQFAFDIWYGDNPHSGDFVVSIGGYNPHFTKPSHYPSVERLTMTWALGPFSLEGKAYFALTPRLMMAGLEISANWHGGPVSAYFDAGIDFMFGWKPFFYEADAYINVGGSLHLLFTFTIHVGAEVTIWGPSFGGEAHVHFIIHFTISFGAGRPSQQLATWSEFREMLPNSYPNPSSNEWALSSIQPNIGLLAQSLSTPYQLTLDSSTSFPLTVGADIADNTIQDKTTSQEVSNCNWIVDPNHFQLNVMSNAPLTALNFNKVAISRQTYVTSPEASESSNPTFVYDNGTSWSEIETKLGISPMGIKTGSFSSKMDVFLTSLEETSLFLDSKPFVIKLVTKSVPAALWSGDGHIGPNGNTDVNGDATIQNALVGIQIMPPIWSPEQTRDIELYYLLYGQTEITLNAETSITPITSSFGSAPTITEPDTALTNASSTEEGITLTPLIGTNSPFFSSLSIDDIDFSSIVYQSIPIYAHLGETKLNSDT